ncbi:hypothetical protein RND71_033727 [Anisodus tanguticus]|uniref:Uncharacterized protein n=1 Tax=Anisodus tanguticus TaxID=243964 RepID=A0AAE1R9Z7_9SOLA|nr:hypothetical protein RND71_033727 [Anisodus tanguticus]
MTHHKPELIVPATPPRERKYLSDIDDQGSLRFQIPILMIIELENNKKLVVDCTGEGILFVEADADVELDKLGESIKPPCPYLDQLLYNVPGSDGIIGCPLLLVQVNYQ